MAYIVNACSVMAYIVNAYIVMAYIVMAYIVKAYIVMAYTVMAYMDLAAHADGAVVLPLLPCFLVSLARPPHVCIRPMSIYRP